ncbi:MAG: peptidoglycan DD-metalloendopeptidase family protein [Balneolales bacterium]
MKRITSHYGMRVHPITKKRTLHSGTDYAQSGTHEIFAVADGTVRLSHLSNSYGEVVYILHNINGQEWETVYAHLRTGSRKVSSGEKVKQGQVLGIMGATGNVTGQHLHFELHKGRWNSARSNSVNPVDYITDGYLEKGKKGPAVTNLQERLSELGYSLSIDGDFGPETESTVKEFQKDQGISVDGLVGPETQKALDKNESNVVGELKINGQTYKVVK